MGACLGLKEPQISEMDTAQSNLFVWYKLEAGFFRGNVRHKICGGGRKWEWGGARDWSNCLRLDKGDFGVVHKQIQETTGHSREGKAVHKRSYSPSSIILGST